jgi:hypothetical protein
LEFGHPTSRRIPYVNTRTCRSRHPFGGPSHVLPSVVAAVVNSRIVVTVKAIRSCSRGWTIPRRLLLTVDGPSAGHEEFSSSSISFPAF